jgi:hypothetical protein
MRKTKYKLTNQKRNNFKEKRFVQFGFVNKHSEPVGNVLKKDGYFPGYKLKGLNFNKGKVCDKACERIVCMIECNNRAKCGKNMLVTLTDLK